MRRESRGMEVKRTTRGKESPFVGGPSARAHAEKKCHKTEAKNTPNVWFGNLGTTSLGRVPLLVPMRTRVDGLQGVHLATCDNVGRVASQRVGENLLTVCCACAFFGPACRFRGARAFKSSGVKGERGGMLVGLKGRLAATQRGS